jgi:hypothetical protein
MTTAILNYSQSLVEVAFNGFKNILKAIIVGYMLARQAQANQAVARELIRIGEYRNTEYWSLVNKLNTQTNEQIKKEYNYD